MNKALLLVGSLGLGAGLMYMLDPERGSRRRALARAQAEMYRRWTDDLLDSTRRTLGRQTDTLSQQAHTLSQRTRGLLGRLGIPLKEERSSGEIWLERAQNMAGKKALLMFGCVGLGLGFMYIVDPKSGQERRAQLSDLVRAYLPSVDNSTPKTARRANNHSRDLASESRRRYREADVEDSTGMETRMRT
jgi:hypothetical protein